MTAPPPAGGAPPARAAAAPRVRRREWLHILASAARTPRGMAGAVLALIVKLDVKGKQYEERTQRPAIEDMAVAWMLTAFLPLMLVVTRLGTGFFQPRYGIASATSRGR